MNKQQLFRLRKRAVPWLLLLPALLVMAAVIAFPIFKVIQYSFIDNIFLAEDMRFVGLSNYVKVLQDPRTGKMLLFTVVFTLGSVVLHSALGVLFAVLLNGRISSRALAFFRVLYVLPWIFTAAVVAITWQLILNPQGVANVLLSAAMGRKVMVEWLGKPVLAVFSLLLINAWRGYPTCMVSFLAGLQNIPVSLYEAAEVDGAGKVRQFFSITLPQLRPIICSMAILDGIWTMNLFPLIWLTTGGGPLGTTETIATLTYRMSFVEYEFGRSSALAVIGLLITTVGIVFYMKLQKQVDF
ncbi:MAG TPA: sugar ABC transporter permease [Candidatus Fournierella merdigallinarum]|nr:sugar ABC transporter permease [Candidatus Fournierella merdigallinarum]